MVIFFKNINKCIIPCRFLVTIHTENKNFHKISKNSKRKAVLYKTLICNKNKLVLTRLVKLFGSVEHLICIGLYRFLQY